MPKLPDLTISQVMNAPSRTTWLCLEVAGNFPTALDGAFAGVPEHRPR
jgi:hypothetical protein